jgi:chromate reductase
MSSGHLLGLCGSLRAASVNRKLMLEAKRVFDPAEFTDANLRLPLYDGDLEDADGIPGAGAGTGRSDRWRRTRCCRRARIQQGAVRRAEERARLGQPDEGNPWRDKPVAILSATAGRAGGERTQNSMRLCMMPFRARVLPGPEVMIGGASESSTRTGG